MVFAKDALKGIPFFSLGPRACVSREMVWIQGKPFFAKVLCAFDVVKVEGLSVDLEKTLLHYGFFEKSEARV